MKRTSQPMKFTCESHRARNRRELVLGRHSLPVEHVFGIRGCSNSMGTAHVCMRAVTWIMLWIPPVYILWISRGHPVNLPANPMRIYSESPTNALWIQCESHANLLWVSCEPPVAAPVNLPVNLQWILCEPSCESHVNLQWEFIEIRPKLDCRSTDKNQSKIDWTSTEEQSRSIGKPMKNQWNP